MYYFWFKYIKSNRDKFYFIFKISYSDIECVLNYEDCVFIFVLVIDWIGVDVSGGSEIIGSF